MMNVLVVDVGGTHVKILATGKKEKREFASGPRLTAPQMVSSVRKLAQGWNYQVVSIGYPGPVLHNRPVAELVFAVRVQATDKNHQRCGHAGARQLS